MFRFTPCLTLAAAVLAAGCCGNCTPSSAPAKDSAPSETTTEPAGLPSAAGQAFLLPGEPNGARGVIDVRKQAKDGDSVVVAGRVGGSSKPFTEGRASFLIADETLKPTEGCDSPW